MNKINYDKQFQQIINTLENKPKLLLHSCCAPCSTLVIERLKKYFDLTIFYYNPNMINLEEYNKRKNEQIKYIEKLNSSGENIKFIEQGFNKDEWSEIAKGKENLPEGSARCFDCYKLRLQKTFNLAKELDFDFFCSTLSVSPYKNAEWLNQIGLSLQTEKLLWLPSDFKKRDGYKISRQIARENNLYEQNFCGCEYSINNKSTT